jgi:chlorophyll synthase
LNDFKSVSGDTRMGIASLPVQLGISTAARVACAVMGLPQILVVALLAYWGRPYNAAIVAVLLISQLALMSRLLASPRERAPWYNATGTSLYVLGMLVSAFALRAHGA